MYKTAGNAVLLARGSGDRLLGVGEDFYGYPCRGGGSLTDWIFKDILVNLIHKTPGGVTLPAFIGVGICSMTSLSSFSHWPTGILKMGGAPRNFSMR